MYSKNCAVIILLLLAVLQGAAAEDIYRCQTQDGKWLFTDGQCNNAEGQKVILSPLVTYKKVKPANLDKAEYRVLIDLERRTAESRVIHSRQQQRISNRIRKDKKIRLQNCAFAELQLAKIQDKRSHGYKVSEAHTLDQKIKNLDRIRRVNCR